MPFKILRLVDFAKNEGWVRSALFVRLVPPSETATVDR